jgi:putative transposase
MATRLPASQHTREELTALIEGRLSTASAKDEHGARPGQGYRNGYRTGRLRTADGLMEYAAPQIAGRDEPFRSAIRQHLRGHTQGLEDLAIEMLARGLSVRDIEDAFKGRTDGCYYEDCGVAAWGSAVGGLPGVRAA